MLSLLIVGLTALAACSGPPSSDAGVDVPATGDVVVDRDVGSDVGSDTSMCPPGFGGPRCLLIDPSLSMLAASAGTLSPAFDPAGITYTVSLHGGATSATLTPTVAHPDHATITIDGARIASGAASAPIDISTTRAHASRITVTTDGGMTRTYTVLLTNITYVKASNTGADDWFGRLVAMSADGSTLVVGAPDESSNARGIDGDGGNDLALQSGAAYVFVRSGDTWAQQAYIKASNAESFGDRQGDLFGSSVAISDDGATIVVGAPWEDSIATGVDGNQADNTAMDSGAAYVFTRSGTTWSQQAYLKASNTDSVTAFGDNFGWAVAISGDGTTVAIGSPYEASHATGIDGDQSDNTERGIGAAYVFVHSGATWSQQAYVKAAYYDAGGSSTYSTANQFGWSIALSGDGSTLAVGAPREHSTATGIDGDPRLATLDSAGAAFVFTRSGTSWLQQAYVKASNTQTLARFGWSVALAGDGATLVVGSPGEASSAMGIGGNQSSLTADRAGAVYVYARTGSTWAQTTYIKASNTNTEDQFGECVAISSDGSTIAAGARFEGSNAIGLGGNQSDNSAGNSGAVYLFTRTATSWMQRTYVKASNTFGTGGLGRGDYFGCSVTLSHDASAFAVGAFDEASSATGIDGNQGDDSAGRAGAVYVY